MSMYGVSSSPKGTIVAASNQAVEGSRPRLAAGSRIRKLRNLP